jgi:hypothetical protein
MKRILAALLFAASISTVQATTIGALAGACGGNAMKLADVMESVTRDQPTEENRNLLRYFRGQQTVFYQTWGQQKEFMPAAEYMYTAVMTVEDRLRVADRCQEVIK